MSQDVDVSPVALFPQPDRQDQHHHLPAIHPINNAVSLAHRTQAAAARQLAREGFALSFRIASKTVDAIAYFFPNASVQKGA